MNLQSEVQLQQTKVKLKLLEQRCSTLRSTGQPLEHSQQLTLRSLTQLINQLKEEVARFKAQEVS